MMCNAIGYIRVSTEDQSTSGLADQRLRIEANCRLRELEQDHLRRRCLWTREIRQNH